jgi:hypothetical protein
MGQSPTVTIRFFGALAVDASKPDSATGDINIIDPGGPKDRVHQCGTKGLVFKKQEDQEKYHNPRGVNLPDQLKHFRLLRFRLAHFKYRRNKRVVALNH